MHAPARLTDAADDELLTLVAEIRARYTHKDLPVPASDAVAAALAHLRDEVPMEGAELAEHERQWRATDDELRAAERADALRDWLRS